MSNPSVEVDFDKANTATKKLEPTTDEMRSSISELKYVQYSQTEGKWGVEPEPMDFSKRYQRCMLESVDDLEDLEQKLQAFITEVRKVLRDFEANESEQEGAYRFAWDRLGEAPADDKLLNSGGGFNSYSDAAMARQISKLKPV